MKKHKILGIILIAIFFFFALKPAVSASSQSYNSTSSYATTYEIVNAEEKTTGDSDNKEAKEPKNHGKAVMIILLVGIPGILFIALGGYSFVMGIILKRKDYLFYGPQLLISHAAFALTCGINGFGANYIYIPVVFTLITLICSLIGLKNAKLDLNAQMASKKSTKKPFVKILFSIFALIALIVALVLEISKDKTLDSEFVGAFFLAIVVLINAFDAGKSLSKFLGSSNL